MLSADCRPETQIRGVDRGDKSILADGNDRIQNGRHRCQGVHIPKADDGPAFCPHKLIADIVAFAFQMLATIKLDDEVLFAARKVGEIWTDGVLADELETVQSSVAQF